MSEKETWTIKKLLDWTTEYFKKYSIEWPHLEAEILLAHTLKLKRIELYIHFERVLIPEELSKFKGFILRRSKHEPIAYITGIQPFMSLDFKVNTSVLIPRPETEKLVEVTIDLVKEFDKSKILDIGTGCGNIAITLAKYIPESTVLGIDSSEEAIEIANENAKVHKVEERCHFMRGDLYPQDDKKFNLIVSNPPYIPTAQIDTLAKDIKDYEPRTALDGGKDGLDCIRAVIDGPGNKLESKGHIAIEIGINQYAEVAKMIENNGNFEKPKVIKDHSGIERVVIAKKL